MFKISHFLTFNYFFLLVTVLTIASCDQRLTSREYEEINILSPIEEHKHNHGEDPHDFMVQLPPDHPDISSSMQLPEGQDKTELKKVLDESVARPPLVWKTPDGWTEERGSGMRLVTFRSKGKSGSIECSIISLGGQAGGLQSNVTRWINQINVDALSQDQLKQFLSRQVTIKAEGGFLITIIDLTELTDLKKEKASSMIGAISQQPDQTIFVKMTGDAQAVIDHRNQFKSLCASLKIN